VTYIKISKFQTLVTVHQADVRGPQVKNRWPRRQRTRRRRWQFNCIFVHGTVLKQSAEHAKFLQLFCMYTFLTKRFPDFSLYYILELHLCFVYMWTNLNVCAVTSL